VPRLSKNLTEEMMKKGSLFVPMLLLATQAAWGQTPADSTHMQAPATTPPVTQATPPPVTPPPPPPPPPAKSTAAQTSMRYGSISGSWLKPRGDFENIASDGWAITLEGFQFITPTRKIAVGSQVGYQSFGEKNGVSVSNFPVDAVLKFYPKPGTGKVDIYGTAGLGFNWQRVDVGFGSNSDYFFGTQAGVGAEIHGSGPVSFVVDGVYHWVFSNNVDSNFIAARAGILVPLAR
jgi:hypothetical protein